MNPVLRILLIVCAFTVLLFVVRKLRKAQFNTMDSLFWLFLSACLFLAALFPSAVYAVSSLLGIQSPSNFVFLAVIALLLIREFTIQAQLTNLRNKLIALTQEIAMRENQNHKNGSEH